MRLAARYTDFNSLSKSFVNRWVVPGDEAITNIPSILDRQIVLSASEEDADISTGLYFI